MIRLFLLFSLNLAACHYASSHRPPARLSYTVEIEPARSSIRVTAQLDQIEPGTYYFVLPRTQGLPVDHFITDLAFRDTEGHLEAQYTEDNDWRVRARSASLSYTYQINLQQSIRYGDQAWGGAANQMDDRMAFLNGSFSFIIPLVEDIDGPIPVSWRVPPAWRLVTPWTVDQREVDIPSHYALVRNYYTAFREGSVTRDRIESLDLTTVWLGKDDINDYSQAVFTIRRVVEAALSLFGEKAVANKESLTLIFRDSNARNQFRASTESNSIEFNFKKGVTFDQIWRLNRQGFLRILAHEMMHTWDRREIEKASNYVDVREWGANTCWIREGFTEYFAMLNLYQAGVFDRDEFVNTMQTLSDAARRVHASQPSSLMNSCRSFLEDEGSMHYAYTEGASLAFKMDLDLRRLTNGLKSLPDFMRRYMESYRYREKSVEAFQAEWKTYAPEALYPMAALAERPNPTVFDTSLRDLGVLDGGERAGAGRRWEAPSDSAFMLYFD